MSNNSVNLFEFGSVVQEEMLLKRFLIWSSGSPPVQLSGTIHAILKEGIMGNIHVKLYDIFGPVVQEEMLFKEKVYVRTNELRTKTNHNTSP